MYNLAVDRSFRMGMMWFIFSEVMFFAAFFGALFYARNLSVPWLAGDGTKIFTRLLLWNNLCGCWPSNGPAALGPAPTAHSRPCRRSACRRSTPPSC